MVNESSNRAAEIQEVVKKLGYSSLEEIKKEKALLTKLEGLMKELGTASDVSEDEAEEIKDEVVAKGEPKSLANKAGEKEEDGEPGGTAEVAEDAAEEIEDDTLAMGEPEDHSEEEGEAVVTTDQEVTDEVPAEADDEDAGNVVPKARIMTFEEFIQEKEVTVNKHVTYQSDEEEPEDYSVPVAERKGADGIIVKDNMGRALAIAGSDVADYKKGKDVWASDEDGEEYEINIDHTDIISEDAAEEIKDEIVAMGEPQDHSEAEGEVVVTKDHEVTEEPETSEDETDEHGEAVVEKQSVEGSAAVNMMKVSKPGRKLTISGRTYTEQSNQKWIGPDGKEVDWTKLASIAAAQGKRQVVFEHESVNEKEITNEKDFEEYAMEIMKQAHPDDFDEEIATKVVTDLKAKYKGDFGKMVGALQSGMGS